MDRVGRQAVALERVAEQAPRARRVSERVACDQGRAVVREALEAVVLMLSPIVPHICDALWRTLGHPDPLVDQPWPAFDESALEQDLVELVVQVNGKLRGRVSVPADAEKDAITEAALAEENVQRFVEGKEVRKVIVVPGRLVNVVV